MKVRTPMHDNWATPKALYDKLDAEFRFDFDPCPLCTGSIPPEKNGLTALWGERNFVNPPYSRVLKEAFVKRAIMWARYGKLSVCLLPVSTSTVLFHKHILPYASEIRFIEGRVRFEGVNSFGVRTTTNCGMHDSMIVVFNPSTLGAAKVSAYRY